MLDRLQFDNRYARLPEAFYTRVQPTPRAGTRVLDVSPGCAARLGLEGLEPLDDQLRALMAGQWVPEGAEPLAQKYTGHQFGAYNPALGDGRGLLLGEVDTPSGPMDLHLKGAGRTPYSRFGDGQAVLRSSVREYLASEAMAGLGIPTTHALAVAINDERVPRERVEPGATLLRVAESHVRFGHFEWLGLSGQTEALKQLADHVIDRHRPWLKNVDAPYAALFADVVERTAHLVADWQAYGFVHAVMNTDNMSILGLTIDYGPYAFLDAYVADRVPNRTDAQGRYAFDQQPGVALWNLVRLAQSLVSLVDKSTLEAELGRFEGHLQARFGDTMRARFGLETFEDEDSELCRQWLDLLGDQQLDYHRSFRALCAYDDTLAGREALLDVLGDTEAARAFLARYDQRLGREHRAVEARQAAMRQCNPYYVLRLHHARSVIEAAEQGDVGPLKEYRACLSAPFEPRETHGAWHLPPEAGAQEITLSCSS
ncbi:protein adenylyltransferase SelO [Larsenimonas suaedae]|uniref:Protein nucleotidyltransferase YdiU n=1 Tax=Larsenimonas suaedae TaxID=1851019 RepID=A0ABU1GXZ2_9GAMM|nr:YdiU family protein [Larsenimonas suaedae]MCM2971454.1 YdiU family protein [Larsenimonas suaedae]MDR5896710.1 YdiU family protein [Larsenimonas suaedae]